ncbi:DUF5336 domain-containing protein [Nakamurella sp. GG22]
MTGNDQQPTGDPPAAPYRSAAPQQPAGYPVTGYQQGAFSPSGSAQSGSPQAVNTQGAYAQAADPQAGYPQAGYPQTGYPQAAYQQVGVSQAAYQPGHERQAAPTAAGYGGGPAVPGPAAWTPADAQRDTGPVHVIGRPGAGASRGGRGSAAARTLDPARLLGLAVAVLGALNFLWGFLPEISVSRSDESLSVFAVGPAYVPVLLLIAGLLALAAFLPGSEVSRLAVAAVSVGGAAGAIVSLGTESSVQIAFGSQASKGMGAILLVIFGIIQAVVAIGAYVVGADVPPWLRGSGSAAATTGVAGGSPSAGPSAALGNPVSRSDQPAGPAAQAGVWSPGQQGGYTGPSGPATWGAPTAAYGSFGQSGGYAAAAYQPPPATDRSADEPATGPQFIVGTETDRNPLRASPAADPGTAASDPSTDEAASSSKAGPDAPARPADPERGPAAADKPRGNAQD